MFTRILADINFKLYMSQMMMSKENITLLIKEVRSTLERIEGEISN